MSQRTLKQKIVYSTVVALVVGLISGFVWKHDQDLKQLRNSYMIEQNAEVDRNIRNIESTFNNFYQGLRTMSLLPGVRTIDRYAKNFKPDSKAAMQQIYNNTYLNVTLSEVYILPATLEPDQIDQNTKKPEIPILTFDQFITSKDESKEKEETEVEEEEIYEYRLMKKQLAYLSSHFPTNKTFEGLNVPVVTGEEVITCDSSEFKKADFDAHNDAPRKGVVMTVPRYDLDGNFAGAVSGVVRTNILKKLFPQSNYGLINREFGWQVVEAPSQDWTSSTQFFQSKKSNPGLIMSQVRELKILDAQPWELWIAKSNDEFYDRNDVKQANLIFFAGIVVSLMLGGFLFYGAWRSFTDQEILQRKVDEKTAALSDRNKQMALILDNAEEGFLTVNLDGTMADERSAIVTKWFGNGHQGIKFWEFVAGKSKSQMTLIKMGWEQLIEDIFPFEICADQIPKMLDLDGKSLSMSFKAVNDANGKLFKVLVMITDVTALVEAAKRELQQRELLQVFQSFSTDRHGFKQFVKDAKSIVQRIHTRKSDVSKDLDFREVHTLKGNASQFGMLSIAQFCHKIETELSEVGRALTDQEREGIKKVWDDASNTTLKDFVNDSDAKQLIVEFEDFEKILGEIRKLQGAEGIFDKLSVWPLESVSIPFKRLGDQVSSLAQRLGKGEIDVIIKDNGVRLDADQLREFWMNATHLVRNVADHGFEDLEELSKVGKARSSIKFESNYVGNTVQIVISDNGRGIDWEKIRSVAKSKSLPHTTSADLENALFADGVSTKDQVTETSGRGVGMAAVKSSILSLGGTIAVTSAKGQGTKFVIIIPIASGARHGKNAA